MKRIATLTLLSVLLLTASSEALVLYARNVSIKQVPEGYLYANGETAEYIDIPQDGIYQVAVLALGTPCAGVWPVMALSLDGFPRQSVSVGSSTMQQYNFSVQLSAGVHTLGFAFLNNAADGAEDRNLYLDAMAVYSPQGVADAVTATQADWFADTQTREAVLLQQTNAAIQTYRMGPASVMVKDASGNALSGATVTVEQLQHDFLFGANLCGYQAYDTAEKNATYLQRFSEVFNYATVPFYWSQIEPVQGQPNYAWTDAMVNWCVANKIQVKGHALLWAYAAALPSWTNGIPTAAVQQAHVTEIMQRYAGLIGNWEVVNEPVNAPGMSMDNPYRWARALDPDGTLISNEYGHFYNGLQAHYDLLNNALASGTPLDAVGFQAHAPADTAFPLEHVQYVLNKYAALNRQIHVTEFTPPSNGHAVLGSTWRGTWTEAQQADYAEDFYRMCFAQPSVSAISWWDFTDVNAWTPNGGLLRSDFSAKPAYTAIQNLIRSEWHTGKQGQTTATGAFDFSGFYGSYRVTVQFGGMSKQVEVHVAKGGTNSFAVTLAVPVVSVNTLLTKSTRPTLTGTFSNATQVKVSVNGSTWYNASLSGSSWSYTMPVAVAAGVYNVRAQALDASGNSVTDATTNELTVDLTVPVITMNGSSSVSVRRNTTYTDAGATAQDNVSGNITARIQVSGSVNTAVLGTYYIRYNVTDVAGNAAVQKTRTVKVIL